MLTYNIQSQNCQVETIASIEGRVMFWQKLYTSHCKGGVPVPRHVRQTKERRAQGPCHYNERRIHLCQKLCTLSDNVRQQLICNENMRMLK